MDTSKLVDDLTNRVRDTVSEAERRAREIVGEAEERARRLVAEAEAEAERVRKRAAAEAEQRLAEVHKALAGLQGALSATRPSSEVEPGPVTVPEPSPPAIPEPSPPVEPEPSPPAEPEPLPPEPEIEPPAPAQPDRSPPQVTDVAVSNGAARGARSGDETAARIVATKMALDHAPRDEIAAHLAKRYDLSSVDELLDDVLARASR